jgi:hypothetical protein
LPGFIGPVPPPLWISDFYDDSILKFQNDYFECYQGFIGLSRINFDPVCAPSQSAFLQTGRKNRAWREKGGLVNREEERRAIALPAQCYWKRRTALNRCKNFSKHKTTHSEAANGEKRSRHRQKRQTGR